MYVTRGDWVDDDSPLHLRELQVFDEGPVDTGPLDSQGRKLFRVPDPIGFKVEKN